MIAYSVCVRYNQYGLIISAKLIRESSFFLFSINDMSGTETRDRQDSIRDA